MDVFYPGAISPHSGVPSYQMLERKRFVYDLELDESLNIIGGEWHSKEHPDFLWGYPEGVNPFTQPVVRVEEEPVSESLPSNLGYSLITSSLAERAISASKRGRVLEDVVYQLVSRSVVTSDPVTPMN